MSKELWFKTFEEMAAEHPELSDETLAQRAYDRQREAYEEAADHMKDERKHGETKEDEDGLV